MRVQTKWFGEIEVSDEKIITFEKGIIGFEDWKKYTLVYDAEKEEVAEGILCEQSEDAMQIERSIDHEEEN